MNREVHVRSCEGRGVRSPRLLDSASRALPVTDGAVDQRIRTSGSLCGEGLELDVVVSAQPTDGQVMELRFDRASELEVQIQRTGCSLDLAVTRVSAHPEPLVVAL
jgi:hypothetical protein